MTKFRNNFINILPTVSFLEDSRITDKASRFFSKLMFNLKTRNIYFFGDKLNNLTNDDITGMSLTKGLTVLDNIPKWHNGKIWVNALGYKYADVKGTSRPKLTTEDEGYPFYDMNLHQPIWWNGNKWIKADGTDADAPAKEYQEKLVSGTNIKTINGDTILGKGDITIPKV